MNCFTFIVNKSPTSNFPTKNYCPGSPARVQEQHCHVSLSCLTRKKCEPSRCWAFQHEPTTSDIYSFMFWFHRPGDRFDQNNLIWPSWSNWPTRIASNPTKNMWISPREMHMFKHTRTYRHPPSTWRKWSTFVTNYNLMQSSMEMWPHNINCI